MHPCLRQWWQSSGPLAIFLVACHTATLWTFGATFWIDSYVYAQLGRDLHDGGIEAAYAGPNYYLMQHIGVGFSWLWAALSRTLGSSSAWVSLAILQHAVAIVAVLWLLRSARWNRGHGLSLAHRPGHLIAPLLAPVRQRDHDGVLFRVGLDDAPRCRRRDRAQPRGGMGECRRDHRRGRRHPVPRTALLFGLAVLGVLALSGCGRRGNGRAGWGA